MKVLLLEHTWMSNPTWCCVYPWSVTHAIKYTRHSPFLAGNETNQHLNQNIVFSCLHYLLLENVFHRSCSFFLLWTYKYLTAFAYYQNAYPVASVYSWCTRLMSSSLRSRRNGKTNFKFLEPSYNIERETCPHWESLCKKGKHRYLLPPTSVNSTVYTSTTYVSMFC